jgi:hypothetical protein
MHPRSLCATASAGTARAARHALADRAAHELLTGAFAIET